MLFAIGKPVRYYYSINTDFFLKTVTDWREEDALYEKNKANLCSPDGRHAGIGYDAYRVRRGR